MVTMMPKPKIQPVAVKVIVRVAEAQRPPAHPVFEEFAPGRFRPVEEDGYAKQDVASCGAPYNYPGPAYDSEGAKHRGC